MPRTDDDPRRFDRGSRVILAGAICFIASALIYVLLAFAQPSDGWLYSIDISTLTVENQAGSRTPLQQGDLVLAIDGVVFEEDIVLPQPQSPPPGWAVGSTARYTVLRDGQTLDLLVPLVTRPPVALLRYWLHGTEFVSSALALLLAFAVIFLRPRDIAARLLLLILVYIATASSIFFAENNPAGIFYPSWLLWYRIVTAFLWPLMFAMIVHFLLIFPVRKWPMTRHARVALTTIYGLAAAGLASLFSGTTTVYSGTLLALLAALVIALVGATTHNLRTVRDPVVRAQIRWVALGLGVSFGTLAVGEWLGQILPAGAAPVADVLDWIWSEVLFLLLPVCLSIAITRYRLFDIDIVLRRTLVYGTLTASLALVYFGSVVLLQQLFRPLFGEQNDLAIVASTLAIAALFQPLRRRIQKAIDRRFFRRKYDAARTLQSFSGRLRDEVEMDRLTNDLLGVVEETLQPAHVSLWLRRPERR